jgi:hypothetical protein
MNAEILNLKDKFPDIYTVFEKKGCKLIFFTKKTEKLKYICECNIEKEKLYKDFMRNRTCRTCKDKSLKEKPNIEDYFDPITNEHWKPVVGGWISNFGNAKNSLNKELTLCPSKFRYHINGKNQYASRLVAETFQIENYEKLLDQNYVVSHIDNDSSNNRIENLKIVAKSFICSINGTKSRKSDNFKEKINWTKNHFNNVSNIKSKVIIEISDKYIFYSNGEIWGNTNFLTCSKSEKYLSFNIKNKTYKVHRLICYAFNPIKDKEKLEDYDDLQVNHKDGNTLNNNAENLEWVSNSKNMYHSYSENLNKKVRNVLQFTLDGEFVKEYISIAEASRQSGEPEHRIREISKGKTNSKAEYLWKFKNEIETEEYSSKFSKS